jgi:hypothetical protein
LSAPQQRLKVLFLTVEFSGRGFEWSPEAGGDILTGIVTLCYFIRIAWDPRRCKLMAVVVTLRMTANKRMIVIIEKRAARYTLW